ncbi:MAG: glycosyltransferase [Prolixibacteraceae bacterium]|nr:glycosyltransferase [Prolixibacteraceae bacterium]
MLSINIPVYNIEIGDLVLAILVQAEKLDCKYEIRIYDDGSDGVVKVKNRKFSGHSNIIYYELKENLGRAAIRNKMGFDSIFKYLLFIDADSKPISENYLENYLQNIKPNCVLCGGTWYQQTKPAEADKLLRWVYGTKREAVSAEIRNSNKGFIITSNNFLIEKEIFSKFHFRGNIKMYGHEDTLLGYDLFKNGIKILHIDNRLEHTGLEAGRVFLEKTRIALKNLYFISNELLDGDGQFLDQVYFLNKFVKITRIIPALIFRVCYRATRFLMEKNLTGKRPQLFFFDLYKIGYYSTLK